MKQNGVTTVLICLAGIFSSTIYGQERCYISNINEFLEECPTTDNATERILEDFTIRKDGRIITKFPCDGPISKLPIEKYTDELIVLQCLRTIYYLDKGRSGHLPWTDMSLYNWLKSKIGGFNISSRANNSSCCDKFDGKKYITLRLSDSLSRDTDRRIRGISGYIGLILHEARHVDGFSHKDCCRYGKNSCDQEYNLDDLSPYGIQYWFYKSIASGEFYTGYTCLSDKLMKEIRNRMLAGANNYLDKFCEKRPRRLYDSTVTLPDCRDDCILKPVFLMEPDIAELDFGQVDSDSQKTETIKIYNKGRITLTFGVTRCNPPFKINKTNWMVNPDTSVEIKVTFVADRKTGSCSDTIRIYNINAPDIHDDISITLKGEVVARRPPQPIGISVGGIEICSPPKLEADKPPTW